MADDVAQDPVDAILRCIAEVEGPRPKLDRERRAQMTDRQVAVLRSLSLMFEDGFAHLTMADIAATVGCSLRTLYEIAPSRDELVMMVIDRNLRYVGRRAFEAVDRDMTALDAIVAYLDGITMAVRSTTASFALDIVSSDQGAVLRSEHSDYLVLVTRSLLDLALRRGEIAPVDTMAVALTIAGLGQTFSNPWAVNHLDSTPKAAADLMLRVILDGLRVTAPR